MDRHGLVKLRACKASIRYADNFSCLQDAWNSCTSASWMIWYLFRVSGDKGTASHRQAVKVLLKILELAIDSSVITDDKEAIREVTSIGQQYIDTGIVQERILRQRIYRSTSQYIRDMLSFTHMAIVGSPKKELYAADAVTAARLLILSLDNTDLPVADKLCKAVRDLVPVISPIIKLVESEEKRRVK